jgi:amidase
MTELAFLSAIAIAKQIREHRTSSREALDYFLARVEALDKRINSVVTVDAARARMEADAADAALARGEIRGPLHGVPMTVKDSFQTAGIRTTSGAPELSAFIPEEDAWPVARLREAGAIIFGKTNLPIYAGDMQSYNEVFGTTNNPHDVSRTPGGSSGGSAAALACGFTPIELGSDNRGLDPSAVTHVRRGRSQTQLWDSSRPRPDSRPSRNADSRRSCCCGTDGAHYRGP